MSILSKKIITVKNNKSFYFSASDFKAAAQPSKSIRSRTFEVIDPPKQCVNVNQLVEHYSENISDFSVDTNAQQFIRNLVDRNICYICGQRIDPDKAGTGPLGSECEHVLSASTIAMLVGLAGNPKDEGKAKRIGDIYFTKVGMLFNLLKSNSNQSDKYDELLTEYKKFRGELFPYLYDWAHPACNRLKDNLPFLKIDFTIDGLKISEVSETEANVEFVLQAILTGMHPSTKKPHSECVEWKKTHLGKIKSVKSLEDFADERLRLVKERAQQIKTKIEATELDKRNLFSLMSTKATLEVVKERTSKYGLFNLMPVLMKFFNGTQDKVKEFVEGLNKSGDKITKLKNKFKQVKSTITTRSRVLVEGRRLRGKIKGVFSGGGWIRGPNGRLMRQEDEIKKEIEDEIDESGLFTNLQQEINITDDTYEIALTMLGLSQEDTIEEKEEYLSDDIIYGALLLLNLNYGEELSEFFSKYPMATSLEEIFRITPEQILGEGLDPELDRFREFCEIFRAYMRCNLLPLVDDVGNIITKNVTDSLSLTRVLIDYHWNDWSNTDSLTRDDGSILQCAFAKDESADKLTGYDSIEQELSQIEKEDLALFQLLGDISEKIVDGLNIRSEPTFDEDVYIED